MTHTPPSVSTGPINLLEYADRVNKAFEAGRPMVLASTHNKNADVALKGSLMVWDADHLAFWERSRLETLEGIRENPRVAALYLNPEQGPPVRFYGEVVAIAEEGELRDRIWEKVIPQEQMRDPERVGLGVLIRVDRVRGPGNSVPQQR